MELYQEALQRFAELFAQAQNLGLDYPQAMSLATVGDEGRPSLRTVLLKDYSPSGFVFYTNQSSRKGRQLGQNPNAALLFYWQGLHQQVEIEGRVSSVTPPEADAYWITRPLESRLGAWASHQSLPLSDRAELEQRYADYERKFSGLQIPRPPHWLGYRLLPERIEFWQEGAFRLHQRTRYQRDHSGHWQKTLLNP